MLFGVVLELATIRQLNVYRYGQFLVMVADVPLVVVCALGLPLGWVAYQAALRPALAYAELIKVAFDLHRKPLLESLGWPKPASLAEEKQLWQSVSNLSSAASR